MPGTWQPALAVLVVTCVERCPQRLQHVRVWRSTNAWWPPTSGIGLVVRKPKHLAVFSGKKSFLLLTFSSSARGTLILISISYRNRYSSLHGRQFDNVHGVWEKGKDRASLLINTCATTHWHGISLNLITSWASWTRYSRLSRKSVGAWSNQVVRTPNSSPVSTGQVLRRTSLFLYLIERVRIKALGFALVHRTYLSRSERNKYKDDWLKFNKT